MAPTDDVRGDTAHLGSFLHSPGFVFDTETTGVSAAEDRVVELGAIGFVDGKPAVERRMRVNPGGPIPAGASAVHGIFDADVRDKPPFSAIAERFAMYLDGRMTDGEQPWLAGYNAVCFDVPLLNAEFRRAGLATQIDPEQIVDPMIFVRWHLRHLRSRSLESVCRHFGIDRGRSHSALDDARATGELLLTLVRSGLLPPLVEPALAEQAVLRRRLDAEWQSFGYWLYHDRDDGRLRLGAGNYIGAVLSDVSPDYLRSLATKISDLPDPVRTTFLAVASREVGRNLDAAAAP